MFTGIVEETGRIEVITQNADSATLKIYAEKVLEDISIGDSIATNGVCLTATKITENAFLADVSKETLLKTNLLQASKKDKVNLERALTLQARLGGHIVTGHVDGIGKVVIWDDKRTYFDLGIQLDQHLLQYVVHKGSIAINGISLTIADIQKDIVKIAIIPHSFTNTNLALMKLNDQVNIECDILGKYVERLLNYDTHSQSHKLTYERLNELGF